MSSIFVTNKNHLNNNLIDTSVNQDDKTKIVKQNTNDENMSYKVSINSDRIKKNHYSYEIYHIASKQFFHDKIEDSNKNTTPSPSCPIEKNFFLQDSRFF